MKTTKLKCHVVGCDRECVDVFYEHGSPDPNYLCPQCAAATKPEAGWALQEPWRTELSEEMIDGLLESMPFNPLTAAAPELLSACKEWVEFYDELVRHEESGDPLAILRDKVHGARVKKTRAAIARATGKDVTP